MFRGSHKGQFKHTSIIKFKALRIIVPGYCYDFFLNIPLLMILIKLNRTFNLSSTSIDNTSISQRPVAMQNK